MKNWNKIICPIYGDGIENEIHYLAESEHNLFPSNW